MEKALSPRRVVASPVGERRPRWDGHGTPGRKGLCKARHDRRFDADHLHVGPQRFDRQRNTGDEAAPADRHDHGLKRRHLL